MDVIAGNMVDGAYQGTIVGKSVDLVEGKTDQALRVKSDSHVDYGERKGQCYHNVDLCGAGLTYAMWLWLENSQTSSRVTVLNSGGARSTSKGILVRYTPDNHKLIVRVQSESSKRFLIALVDAEVWFHVVFTWSEYGPVHLYFNGCPADESQSGSARPDPVTEYFPFTVGSVGTDPSANMLIDALQIWYTRLSAEQIWAIYINS